MEKFVFLSEIPGQPWRIAPQGPRERPPMVSAGPVVIGFTTELLHIGGRATGNAAQLAGSAKRLREFKPVRKFRYEDSFGFMSARDPACGESAVAQTLCQGVSQQLRVHMATTFRHPDRISWPTVHERDGCVGVAQTTYLGATATLRPNHRQDLTPANGQPG